MYRRRWPLKVSSSLCQQPAGENSQPRSPPPRPCQYLPTSGPHLPLPPVPLPAARCSSTPRSASRSNGRGSSSCNRPRTTRGLTSTSRGVSRPREGDELTSMSQALRELRGGVGRCGTGQGRHVCGGRTFPLRCCPPTPVDHDVKAKQLEAIDAVRDGILRREKRHQHHFLHAPPHRLPRHTLQGEQLAQRLQAALGASG